jgi:peptide/nickel transport system substrate-binding protein
VWTVAPDPAAALALLLTGAADVFEAVRPEHLPAIARRPELTTVAYPGLQYGFLVFNVRGDATAARGRVPLFGDRALRRALAQALDRRAMVRNVFDSLAAPALGPFARASSTADTTIPQLAHDPAGATRTLDSLGWRDANGDGVRERNGRPLAFTLIVPATSAARIKFAVLIQEQLRNAGVRVAVEQLDFNAFLARLGQGRFDAAMGMVSGDPSAATVRQFWGGSSTRAKKGSNAGSYVNAEFDAAVDSATASFDPAAAKAHFRRAYATIVADAPAVWLYEAQPVAGVHRRVRVVGMRADAWWAGLADWSIPPAERIERDRIGLRTASR